MRIQQRQEHVKAARSIARTLGIKRAAGYLRNMGWSVEGSVAVLVVRKGANHEKRTF